MYKILKSLDEFIDKSATWLLVVSVFVMLLFSVILIILRWFGVSFMWADPMIRHVVFLSAFLGGVVATGKKSHICIDILKKQLEHRGMLRIARASEVLVDVIASATLVWLIYSSILFVKIELEFGKPVFWGIKSGFLFLIIPIGFSLLAYRFAFLALDSIIAIKNGKKV